MKKDWEDMAVGTATAAALVAREHGDIGDMLAGEALPSPLSGEWAGESIPELFGTWPDGDILDAWETLYWETFYRVLDTGTV